MQFKLKNPDEFTMTLAKRGFTRNHFSKVAKVSRAYLHQIVKHEQTFGPVTAKKISDTLAMEFEELFTTII